MKITINIDNNQLIAINNMMAIIDQMQFINTGRSRKSSFVICWELRETLMKKAIDKRLTNKPFKLKMPYYKADALWWFLTEFYILFEFTPGSYEENVHRMITGELHQKLQ